MSNIVITPPTKESGLYKEGFLHTEGGIAVKVDGVKDVEVEVKEYKLCRESMESTEVHHFKNKTNLQILDALFKESSCTFETSKAKSREFILCRLVVLDKKKRNISGTPKEIVNQMQAEKSCNLSSDSDTMMQGGKITCGCKHEEFEKKSFGGTVDAKNIPNNTFVDKFGRERFEIHDKTLILNYNLLFKLALKDGNTKIKLAKLIPEWDGYSHYPDLKTITVVFEPIYATVLCAYNQYTDTIIINSKKIKDEIRSSKNSNAKGVKSDDKEDETNKGGSKNVSFMRWFRQSIRRRLVHELQHAIQKREGIEISISSPDYILKKIKEKYNKENMDNELFKDWIQKKEGKTYKNIEYDFYINLPSEKEALEVEKRFDLTLKERKNSIPEFRHGGEIKEINKLYKDHHEAWDKAEEIQKNVCEETCVKYSNEISDIFESELLPHFKEEEQVFFPSIRNSQNAKSIDELLSEHVEMTKLQTKIKKNKKSGDIKKFCEILKSHIQKEEKLMSEISPDPYMKKGVGSHTPKNLPTLIALPDQSLNRIENKKRGNLLNEITSFEEFRYSISPSLTEDFGNRGELLTNSNTNIQQNSDSANNFEEKKDEEGEIIAEKMVGNKFYDHNFNGYFTNPVDKSVNANEILLKEAEKLDGGLEELKSSLPTQVIPLDKIIPTQDGFSVERYKALDGKDLDLPLVIKIGEFYYIEDGHHRILKNIIEGKEILALVFDISNKMANGGYIEPHKEVSASVNSAIKDLLESNYADLKLMEASMLYNSFKEYENLESKDVYGDGEMYYIQQPPEGMASVMFKNLDKKGYVIDDDYDGRVYAWPSAIEFVDAVRARIQTRRNVKSGSDLFPEMSNIPEIKLVESEPTYQDMVDAISGIETMIELSEGEEKQDYIDAVEGLKTMLEFMNSDEEKVENVQMVEEPIKVESSVDEPINNEEQKTKYAYKAGDEVTFYKTATDLVTAKIQQPSVVSDDGVQVWSTNKGYAREDAMLPKIVSAKRETGGGSGYKAFKGIGTSMSRYEVKFADKDSFTSYRASDRDSAINEAIRHRLYTVKNYPKSIIVKKESEPVIEVKKSVLPDSNENFIKEINLLLDENKTMTNPQVEKVAEGFGIKDKNLMKELVELTIVLKSREIGKTSAGTDLAYKKIVNLYQTQPNLSHRTSESILKQQYSTSAPLAFLMGKYIQFNNDSVNEKISSGNKSDITFFEASAGNGLLTIASDPKNFVVNEIDPVRFRNLEYQGYKEVMSKDASLPFKGLENSFDGILTNPPFGSTDAPYMFGTFAINSMEQLMALIALQTMNDNGKAAIIIGGHLTYDEKGRITAGKNRIFYNYLHHNYNVEDCINISGQKLYSRQGTGFNVRAILINGRKVKPEGFAPLLDSSLEATEVMSNKIISNFDDLYTRFEKSF